MMPRSCLNRGRQMKQVCPEETQHLGRILVGLNIPFPAPHVGTRVEEVADQLVEHRDRRVRQRLLKRNGLGHKGDSSRASAEAGNQPRARHIAFPYNLTEAADELAWAGAIGTVEQHPPAAGWAYQERQRACPHDADRGGLVLPLAGARGGLLSRPGGRVAGRDPSGSLAGAGSVVPTPPAPDGRRQAVAQGSHRDCARTGQLRVGHCPERLHCTCHAKSGSVSRC